MKIYNTPLGSSYVTIDHLVCDNCKKEYWCDGVVASCGYNSDNDGDTFDFCSDKCCSEFFAPKSGTVTQFKESDAKPLADLITRDEALEIAKKCWAKEMLEGKPFCIKCGNYDIADLLDNLTKAFKGDRIRKLEKEAKNGK